MTNAVVGKRTNKTTGAAPAPARHNKGQTEHILKTIEGYDSALTVSAILASVLAVWLVPAVLYVLDGILGLGGGGDRIFRLANAVVAGSAVLGTLSTILLIHWYSRVRANVATLDADPTVVPLNSIIFAAKVGVPAVVLVVLVNLVPGFARFGGLAFMIAFIAVTSGIAHFVLQAARMLWRTSVSPAHTSVELPATAVVAVLGWFVSLHLLWGVRRVAASTPWGATHSLVLIGAGLTMAAVAVCGAMFISAVGERQEARLFAMGERVGDQRSVAPVSSTQIKEAWSDSESLVGFDFD